MRAESGHRLAALARHVAPLLAGHFGEDQTTIRALLASHRPVIELHTEEGASGEIAEVFAEAGLDLPGAIYHGQGARGVDGFRDLDVVIIAGDPLANQDSTAQQAARLGLDPDGYSKRWPWSRPSKLLARRHVPGHLRPAVPSQARARA